MASLLGWYVLVVVLAFVGLFFAASYAQATSSGDFDTTWNTPIGWLLVAATVGVVSVGVIGVYGTEYRFSGRRDAWSLFFNTVPLVGGWVALAVAVSHARLVDRFRRAEETQTVTVPSTERPIIVTGEVEATTEAHSPALSHPAVCWTWEFSIRGVAGQSDGNWLTRKVDSGGVPFDLDDGSGPVRVDDDGILTANRIYRPGMASTASQRYAVRAVLAAGGGLVAIWIGVRLAAGYFGTPLPV